MRLSQSEFVRDDDMLLCRAASRVSGAEDNTKGLVHIYVDSVKGEFFVDIC